MSESRGTTLPWSEVDIMSNGLVSGLFVWDERDRDYRNAWWDDLCRFMAEHKESDDAKYQRARLRRALQNIVETLEDNPDAPEWMVRELAQTGREVLKENPIG